MCYTYNMIKSFKCKKTKSIWEGRKIKSFPIELQNIVRRKLRIINNAQDINDLRVPPGNRLERLIGDRKGQYSIRINQQWRICFIWEEEHAFEVHIIDYH